MDFFESQEVARRNTRLLIIFFGAAVLSLVAMTNLLVLMVANYQNSHAIASGSYYYSWTAFFAVSGFVLAFIALGSLYRIVSLSKGGEAVAAMLGGKLLVSGGSDLGQQRLLNVVEEMAIASGTPVPPVYLIPDDSINAFAAGYSTGDAVIGVTEGAISNLNREQLQGVIAHEFSHVLNGDMRLNIRLMGVLYGILMLAIVGRIILSPHRTVRTSNRKGSGGAIVAIGIGLLVLGYIGQFFGNLIKAAVSRQREFLADASAVQFTRNPEGISGALKRIGGYAPGSIVKNRNSEEVSHAFFAQGVKVMLGGLLSTHPPLDERIKRIDPRWDGEYLLRTAISTEPQAEDLAASVSGFDADQALRDIGNPGPSQLNVARNIIHSMPAGLTEAAHEPYSARAVTYLVLLATDPLVRGRQLEQLARSADATVFARVRQLLPTADTLSAEMRLPLLEMVMPALRQLTTDQYRQFRQNIDALIAADQKITLSEWALGKYIRHHLEEAFEGRKGRNRFSRYSQVKRECAIVFSVLALSDTRSSDSRVGFDYARRLLDIEITLVAKGELRLSVIDEAIDKLRDLAPLKKPKLLKACVAIITADKVVSPVEAELVRAIADSLDCPMPPLLSSFTSSE